MEGTTELKRLERLRMLLSQAHAHAERGDDPDLLATIEAMSRVVRRSEALASDDRAPSDVEGRWRSLGAELRACMDADEHPSMPRGLALARAARSLLHEFAGGDLETLAALAHLRSVAPPQQLAGWDAALIRYLDRALAELAASEA